MATKKAAWQAAREYAAKLEEFFIFPTILLQKILASEDGFEFCVKIGIYHHAIKMMQKDDFEIGNKEILSILREYSKYTQDFQSLSSNSQYWLSKWFDELDSEIIQNGIANIPGEIQLFTAIRRTYALLNLTYSPSRAIAIMEYGHEYKNLNWKKSFVVTNTTFIFRCRDYAKKSRKNERERILFCFRMAIASIIGLRREWATTNQKLIKARMFGFESAKEYDKFLSSRYSPKWLKSLIEKYTTRRVFDGLVREILERGWCKTIEGTPYRCTIVSITKDFPEISNEVNLFFGKKMGKKNVHL